MPASEEEMGSVTMAVLSMVMRGWRAEEEAVSAGLMTMMWMS